MAYLRDKYLGEMILVGATIVPPSSSGKDGYDISFNDKRIFVSNSQFDLCENEVNKLRLGFIKDGNYFGLTEDSPIGYKPSELRYSTFLKYPSFLLKNN